MADITCEVIKDLLPLYVDEVLSDDSRKIVEEHLRSCKECAEYYENLKYPAKEFVQKKRADDKAVLNKIRKRMTMKKLRAALIAAACVAAVIMGVYYGTVIHESYISYEESGIYVTEDALRTDIPFYKSVGIYSPDGESLFLFLTSTVHSRHQKDDSIYKGAPFVSLTEEDRTIKVFDDNQTLVEEQLCKEIYYLPEEKAKQFMHVMKWTNEGSTDEEVQKNRDQEVEELKNISVLGWSDSE